MYYLLEEMTAEDIVQVMNEKTRTVVVPFSMTEWHDKHLPVGCDNFLAEEISRRICERIGAFLAPTVKYGFSPGRGRDFFRDKGGTCMLPLPTLVSQLTDIYKTLVARGFNAVVFICGHGPNVQVFDAMGISPMKTVWFPAVAQGQSRFQEVEYQWEGSQRKELGIQNPEIEDIVDDASQLKPGVKYESATILRVDWFAPAQKKTIELCGRHMIHADDGETSLFLAVRPDLARMDRAEGPARKSTQAKGKQILDWAVEYSARFIDAVIKKGRYYYFGEGYPDLKDYV